MAIPDAVRGDPGILETIRGAGEKALRWLRPGGLWLEERLDEERGRWFLWLPVLYGAGIAIYLSANTEPPFLVSLAMLLIASILRHFLRFTALRLIASTTLLMLAAGIFTGKLRALVVDAPVLTRSIGAATITGRIEAVERYQRAFRVTLRLESLDAGYKGAAPHRVRLRYHAKAALPEVGSLIKLRASLRPPPEPVMPGGFDFARHHWFEGLGATGFVLGKIEVLPAGPPPWDIRVAGAISGLRQAIAARIAGVLSGEAAALAQALIMGERASISEQTQAALTNSGLAHVVSISGFHMALTAGSAFWLFRAGLAFFPSLALVLPIKIWAALAALAVASFYLMISGGGVAAVRSYIMIAIMFGAYVLNRPALSLRNLALSALLILAITPESLADPGFQMSFAATAALVAVYEERINRYGPPGSWPWLLAMPARAVIGVVVTSLAAGLAVDPIAAYHFHRVAAYSVLGNMLAMPAISIAVMPMALLALVAMPFGMEGPPLYVMGWGIEAMMAIAGFVSGLPGAVVPVPAFEFVCLVLIVIGGSWLLLWRGSWRFAGLVPIAAGLASTPFLSRPDIFVDREGQVIAVRLKDGRLSAPKTRKSEFSLKAWLEADGDARPPRDVAKGSGFQCDEQSCLAVIRGRIVSHVLHPAALAEDCRRAVVLTALPVTGSCPGPQVIIDKHSLWEKGAQTIRFDREMGEEGVGPGIRIETVAEGRGVRPWAIVRHRRELIAPVPGEAEASGKGGNESDPARAGSLEVQAPQLSGPF